MESLPTNAELPKIHPAMRIIGERSVTATEFRALDIIASQKLAEANILIDAGDQSHPIIIAQRLGLLDI